MNFKEWLFQEMPIANFTKIGDFSPDAKRKYGFDKKDAGILSNQNAIDKIHRKWSNSKENFDFYFVRQPNAYKHVEVGAVSSDWVKQNLNLDIQPNEDSITVIFTNNIGTEKIPMTAWGMAHRFGHAIRRDQNYQHYIVEEIEKDFKKLLKEIYNYQFSNMYGYNASNYNSYGKDQNALRALAYAVGTMRSARQRNLVRFGEFPHEITAQYLITGKVKFNPLPNFLITRNSMAWGRPNPQGLNATRDQEKMEEWNEQLQGYAGKYEHYLDSIFMGLVGKIFVM